MLNLCSAGINILLNSVSVVIKRYMLSLCDVGQCEDCLEYSEIR